MAHDLSFEKTSLYDPGESGISIGVELRIGSASEVFEAKLDTGATFCVFEREIGERLGVDIESGERRVITTVTG
ncbi:MAG: hypothetical protein ACRD6X_05830 [Pyrinomonadaceae bacterium]